MKKVIIGIVVLAIIGVGVYIYSTSAPAPAPKLVAAAPAIKVSNKIVAEARVVPVRSASLSFEAGGTVDKVAVVVGDRVQAGQVLAQLETRHLELQAAQAEANLAVAQSKLDQLRHAPTTTDLAAAQQNLAAAQAALDDLSHPSESELATLKTNLDKAKVALDRAQAAYDRIGGDGNIESGWMPQRVELQSAWLDYRLAESQYNTRLNPTNAQVQQALSAVQTAQAQLAKLQPTADDLAIAEASVKAAQIARDLAAEQLDHAKLVAPFAGTITSLDVKAGESVASGLPVLRLADVSAWQMETTDLTELNVVKIQEGTPATVTLDAIPGLEMAGKVTRMKLYGENKQGDIVYTAIISPDRQDERLRWNMTAQVSIEPQ